jgi:hypothetical protein
LFKQLHATSLLLGKLFTGNLYYYVKQFLQYMRFDLLIWLLSSPAAEEGKQRHALASAEISVFSFDGVLC